MNGKPASATIPWWELVSPLPPHRARRRAAREASDKARAERLAEMDSYQEQRSVALAFGRAIVAPTAGGRFLVEFPNGWDRGMVNEALEVGMRHVLNRSGTATIEP